MTGAIIMFVVAIVCAGGAWWVFARSTHSEASVYRNRIAATMLAAGALILAGFAAALLSWGVAR